MITNIVLRRRVVYCEGLPYLLETIIAVHVSPAEILRPLLLHPHPRPVDLLGKAAVLLRASTPACSRLMLSFKDNGAHLHDKEPSRVSDRNVEGVEMLPSEYSVWLQKREMPLGSVPRLALSYKPYISSDSCRFC